MKPMPDYADVYADQRDFLWGYCYRLTGSAADAEDLVQETFVRALERPPVDTAMPWRPWLVRVATNLAYDEARKRKRRDYAGVWLPSPIETDAAGAPVDASSRYDLVESASMAFLLALEALTPRQRAVLLLRDVYDLSVAEAAEALDITPANVKTTHHRARQALADYDASRRRFDAERLRRARAVLGELLARAQARDVAGLEALLAAGVRSMSDGAGEFYTARVPVVGREKVALFYSRIAAPPEEEVRVEFRELGGLAAVVVERPGAPEGWATRFAVAIDVDDAGLVDAVYAVVAPEKLAGLR